MRIPEIIRKKRDGKELSDADIAAVVAAIADGTASEGQVGAFGMAVVLRGMSVAEQVALTRAMTASGRTLDWSAERLAGPVLDKHSTGGVGDKVSLVLVPLVASCGPHVPMISGRGLGHTGGTVDKLESIPGYGTAPDVATFQRLVRETGCAIIGQTADLAPADRRFYAVRDVTATVESIPLITASVLSKKLAAGLHGLVLDVKTGSGALAAEPEAARELAKSLVEVASRLGLPATALVTDMDQVLGRCAGNALEVREAVAYLTGRQRDDRLHAVVLALGAEMLVLGGVVRSPTEAHARLAAALDSGRAAERFGAMVAALGGPRDLVERPQAYLPAAPVVTPVYPYRPGVIAAMDARAVGLAVVRLGGGRSRPGDAINHAVGVDEVGRVGEPVDRHRPLAVVHAASWDAAREAEAQIREAVRVAESVGALPPVVRARVAASEPATERRRG